MGGIIETYTLKTEELCGLDQDQAAIAETLKQAQTSSR
jgi:hypothetical protein